MSISGKVVNGIKYAAFFSAIIVLGIFLFDLFFARPLIMQGIIVDKIYVPTQNSSANSIMPYMRYKTKDYTVSAQKHEQWVALVKLENGQVLKVNCHSDHYQLKEIGDTLHFKEYAGDIMGIDYFSHNEEDEEKEGL
jgi:hypothetical protein